MNKEKMVKESNSNLKGYAKTIIKGTGALVITYLCSSQRMKKAHQLSINQFRKEIAIALGFRKYTPELKKEFLINETLCDVLESLDLDCKKLNLYKHMLKNNSDSKTKDDILNKISAIEFSVFEKTKQLKILKHDLKVQTRIANNVQKNINISKKLSR